MKRFTLLRLQNLSIVTFFCMIYAEVSGKRMERKWEGVLVFKDDFDEFEVRKKYWKVEESCGKEYNQKNLECFSTNDENVHILNGTLVIRAIQKPLTEMKLYAKPKNYTSGKLKTTSAFSHGTFVISAKMPKGMLFPSIWLVPGYQDHENCKYEEIEIVQARGEKTSNLMFSASFGKNWRAVSTKRMEKAFPGVDFSESFHEYALVWKPLRIDWFVDGKLVYTVSTYFYSDWILYDESNLPCSINKSLFKQPLQLSLSLSVGRNNANESWIKPTFEVDWVKVYQFNNN